MNQSPIVMTRAGKLEGLSFDDHFVFRGIPYAEAPIGARRWSAPEPTKRWTGVRPAKEFGAAALPLEVPVELASALVYAPQVRSEDCLYLNVWTPGLDDAKRPVMVWIHGGGWSAGAGSQPHYDGSILATRGDAVIVTFNYRLGALGSLRLVDLTSGQIESTGNEGRLDQVAALSWVQENIRAFGGDPDNVTIFGQSSGGADCAFHLASPLSEGMFRRAIIQSTHAHTAHDVDNANRVARIMLDLLGVGPKDVEIIRALTPDQLRTASAELPMRLLQDDPTAGVMHYHSVVDGTALLERPIDAIRNGSSNDVSLLTGTNFDEVRFGLAADEALLVAAKPISESMDDDEVRVMLSWVPEEHHSRLIDAYRASREKHGEPSTPRDILQALDTARVCRIPKIRLLEAKRAHSKPGHAYLFTWRSPWKDGRLRACHALELGFVWGTYRDASLYGTDGDSFCGTGPDADALAPNIQDAWLAFARTGDPSHDGIGHWPAYGEARETMLLDKNCEVVNAPYDDERQAWDGVPDTALGVS